MLLDFVASQSPSVVGIAVALTAGPVQQGPAGYLEEEAHFFHRYSTAEVRTTAGHQVVAAM